MSELYILKKNSSGKLLALDRRQVWTSDLAQAEGFAPTYGKLVAKALPGAFTTTERPRS
jgi:hypothetical protein